MNVKSLFTAAALVTTSLVFLSSPARAGSQDDAIESSPSTPALGAGSVSVSSSMLSPLPPPELPAPRAQSRYGLQTLAVDGAAIVLPLAIAASTPGHSDEKYTAVAAVWVLGYGLGAPIVHFAHGHVTKGFADIGIRLAAPIMLGSTGYVVGSLADGGTGNGPISLGALLALIGGATGYLGAAFFDAGVLAREDVAPAPTAVRIAPDLQVRKTGTSVGLRGTF